MILAAALLSGRFPVVIGLLSAGLFAVFAVVSGYAYWTHRKVPCNCFGSSRVPMGPVTVVRAAVLAAAALGHASVDALSAPPDPDLAITVVASVSLLITAYGLNKSSLRTSA